MIEHLFFFINEDIEKVAIKIFSILGNKNNFLEGDSSHVLGGAYYSVSIFGIEIRLEKNSYDYDDEYNYMLRIAKDTFSDVIINTIIIKQLTNIVIALLVQNLNLKIAYEEEGQLKVY